MSRPKLDPGPPAAPRSRRLQALEDALQEYDHPVAPGGRLLVFRAGERVAVRTLEQAAGATAGESARVRGACMVLLSTVAAILELQREQAGWPIDYILQDLALAIGGLQDLKTAPERGEGS